ncbi:MAG: DUF177 domain-containing protein [Dysgonamonadaceae bacterium]|nr:DUF177 domain-containing protein [Dysgonamonadaceae bacterium]
MGKFDTYKVDLKGMQQEVQNYEYFLDNPFFANIDGEELQKGKIHVQLTVTRIAGAFNLAFKLSGNAVIPCDRCLDDMDYPIETTARLIVKFGKDYSEESDEIVIIPEAEGVINLAWFLYEFVALAIPIKHIHAPGKCNKQMSAKLKKHTAKATDDDAFDIDGNDTHAIAEDPEDNSDPRWDALKQLDLEY